MRPECDACRRPRGGFRLQSPQGSSIRCLACVLHYPPLLRRSILIALIVGTVLLAINQGDALLAGRWDGALAWKAPLTYLVPFVVATWGALANSRVR